MNSIRILLLSTIFLFGLSCAKGTTYSHLKSKGRGGFKFDAVITSVEYYKNTYNIDLTGDPEKTHYYIGVDNAPRHIEIQQGDFTCWASCLQYLINFKNPNRHIEQDEIISKIKPGANPDNIEAAASLLETIEGLGLGNFSVSGCYTRHLLEALHAGYPVLLSYYVTDNMAHDVIIIKANYVELGVICKLLAYLPSGLISCCAFIDFEILDPADGNIKMLKASEIEGKTNYMISFSLS